MCGIAGFTIQINKEELIERVKSNLYLRGPDSQDHYTDENISLIATRLKIQDLHGGSQPFKDNSSPWILVYNGELYNTPTLKKDLKSKGYNFETTSDTEIVYKSFLEYNTNAFIKFNGMFSLCFYNLKTKEVILANDRFGIKPLFYLKEESSFSFSSNISTFKTIDKEIKVSPLGIINFLKYNYTTFENCIFQDIKRVRPGSYISINLKTNAIEQTQYWDFSKIRNSKTSNDLNQLLSESVKTQLISDRKLGVFQSSGIDSSYISSEVAKRKEGLNLYNVGFNDKSFDESSKASVVARHLNVGFKSFTFDHNNFKEIFNDFVAKCETPLADLGLYPLFFLCQNISDDTTVFLSGDGADELFAGYPTIKATLAIDKIPKSFSRPLKSFTYNSAKLFKSRNKNNLSYKLQTIAKNIGKDPIEAHCSWRNVFNNEELKCLLPDYIPSKEYNQEYTLYYEDAKKLFPNDKINQLLYLDFKFWLPLNNFIKLDTATSSHSLEGRVPYLDNNLVNYMFSQEGHKKWSFLGSKELLRKEAKTSLPIATIKTKKAPFHPPYRSWFTKELKEFIETELLNSILIREYGFNKNYIKQLITENNSNKFDHTFKLYNLLYLGKWLELH